MKLSKVAARGFLVVLLTALPVAAEVHFVQLLEQQPGVFVFSPQQLTIDEGDTVTWTSQSEMAHNVTADDGSFRCAVGCDQGGGNGTPIPGPWSFEITFGPGAPTFGGFTGVPGGGGGGGGPYVRTPPGISPRVDRTLRYHCQVHGGSGGAGMSGSIVVQAPDGGGGGGGGGGGDAVPGALRFAQAAINKVEDGGSAVARVQRVGGDDGAVSVGYTTANGTAASGSDYTPKNGTLHWQDGESGEKTFTVTILDDSVDESNETVLLQLASPTGGAALGAPQQATLTIVDDDGASQGPGEVECLDGDESLCLLDRFLIKVHWRQVSGQQGEGRASKLSDGAGGFEFFEAGNLEIFVKMTGNPCFLSAGNPIRNYWVFLAGLTDVEVVVTIVDTVAGVTKTYTNPLKTAFKTVQATTEAAGAFATCGP